MCSHYQERTATELYHQLSSTVQQPKEKPQEFLIRLLDLKQKFLFASQETDSELKYDPTLVRDMFVHSFSLGLQIENIKIKMKPYPEKKTMSDEKLFEKLNVCVSNEMEQSQKFGSQLTPKVNAIQEGDKQTKKNTEVEQALMKELRELKEEVAAVKERVRTPPQAQNLPTQQHMRQTLQCRTCQQSGNRWLEVMPMGHGVTGHESQSRCVQCGKQGTDHVPLNRCGACKISRYCSKGCQVKHRTVHKPICMAIQELEKKKAAEDADDDSSTTFPCHLTPRQQAGLTKLVGRRCMVKYLIWGKEVEALWDTGSQVCVMSRKWRQSHLPLEVLTNVEELLGAGEELNLEAMNGTDIPFVG